MVVDDNERLDAEHLFTGLPNAETITAIKSDPAIKTRNIGKDGVQLFFSRKKIMPNIAAAMAIPCTKVLYFADVRAGIDNPRRLQYER